MDDESDQDWMTIGEAVDAVLAELGMGDRRGCDGGRNHLSGLTTGAGDIADDLDDGAAAETLRFPVSGSATADDGRSMLVADQRDLPTCRVLVFMPRAHRSVPRAEANEAADENTADDRQKHPAGHDEDDGGHAATSAAS